MSSGYSLIALVAKAIVVRGSGAVRLEGSSPSGRTNTVFQGGCRLRNILPKMVGKERTAEYWIRLLARVSSV